eukprot:COSAG06_NODE_5271_length_3595_cov_2.700801_2_plen_83_part_01
MSAALPRREANSWHLTCFHSHSRPMALDSENPAVSYYSSPPLRLSGVIASGRLSGSGSGSGSAPAPAPAVPVRAAGAPHLGQP